MPQPANLVHETSTSTGTGNLTLSSENGKQTFNGAFGTGGTDVFDYFISNRSAAEWERGTGHMSDATTFVRDTVLESTNSDAAVDFSAGTKDVTNDVPAGLQIFSPDNASAAQGDVLYHNGSFWKRLAAGTSGQFLQTQGAGANPQWTRGASIVETSAVDVSGGSVADFTSLPSDIIAIEIYLDDVGIDSGTESVLVQIGDNGGFKTTGYVSVGARGGNNETSSTSGFIFGQNVTADDITAIYTLKPNPGVSNQWLAEGQGVRESAANAQTGQGYKTLSGTLDRVRVTTTGNSFDSGSVTLRYWRSS